VPSSYISPRRRQPPPGRTQTQGTQHTAACTERRVPGVPVAFRMLNVPAGRHGAAPVVVAGPTASPSEGRRGIGSMPEYQSPAPRSAIPVLPDRDPTGGVEIRPGVADQEIIRGARCPAVSRDEPPYVWSPLYTAHMHTGCRVTTIPLSPPTSRQAGSNGRKLVMDPCSSGRSGRRQSSNGFV